VSTKIKAQQKVNDTDIFVDEVETQLREKPLRGSETQEWNSHRILAALSAQGPLFIGWGSE
jgi:hypothetical protein